MLDTLGLRSPPISDALADHLEYQCTRRSGEVVRSGEILYQITQGDLVGSWDSKICFRVERERWVSQPKRPPVRQPSLPYLTIEGSVHKLLLGHNCFGGPIDVLASGKWLLDLLATTFEVDLPPWSDWEIRRIDWAEVWALGSFESCQEFMRGLVNAEFPRRKKLVYGLETIFFPGHTTSNKIYHKGPEFWTHDRKRLLKHKLERSDLDQIQCYANTLLRAEVGIKAEKLDYDFNRSLGLSDINQDYLIGVFSTEITRILREAKSDMKRVNTAREVQSRLHKLYSPSQASALFGYWMQLSAFGEDVLRKSLPRRTFYRYRKKLQDAGCTWHGSDVVLRQSSLIPADFSMTLDSPYRLTAIDPRVSVALEPYMSYA